MRDNAQSDYRLSMFYKLTDAKLFVEICNKIW